MFSGLKLNVSVQLFTIDFRSTNKRFSFLEISIVYNKSDQHNSIYYSYNIELASTKTKLIKLENASNTYSSFNEIKFDADDKDNEFLLYNPFVVWNCDGCSITPLSDYANNKVYQELPRLKNLFDKTYEKLYIDLRRSKGYNNELENLSRDDSDIKLTS